MGWQISFLLGFFLLFSICVSLPSDDQYVTNSFGIKHYVLTPEILDASSSGDIAPVRRVKFPVASASGNLVTRMLDLAPMWQPKAWQNPQ